MTSKGQEKMSHPIAHASDEITIGIDISKDNLDVHLHPEGTARQFPNDRKGHAKLIAWAAPYQPTRVVFEATGRYHRALEMALGEAGLPAVKINPLQARRFAEATGKRVKTDPIDAAMLARFGAIMRPEIPPAKDQTIDMLAELLAARRGLVKDRTAASNRGKSLTLAMLKRQPDYAPCSAVYCVVQTMNIDRFPRGPPTWLVTRCSSRKGSASLNSNVNTVPRSNAGPPSSRPVGPTVSNARFAVASSTAW